MRVVTPLAGPDFILDGGKLKAEIDIDGEPLLRRVLSSRPWANSVQEYSFILIDTPETRAFATNALTNWYPRSSITFISSYTRGAALSALAGMATSQDIDEPVIVDLADILYASTLDPTSLFRTNANCSGIALTFKSDSSAYSYLRLDTSGSFEKAAEKKVISNHASAGTYIFRDLATYLRALAHSLENQRHQTFRDLFFVCPLFNGVKDQGKSVLLEPVTDVIDIKVEQNR
jgi:hypothetical protein